ncbi:TetR/AcrR family transcriptional regulator [Halomonas sp. TRM85114]|uniref:TetR/AcrR family transcriptional regulator n=1 Tax=Halomonas jincaotanensis TaxID=2810616 RepID=UPI001BD3C5A5|nr:TetR/AcrR family transcriptional regulator [Halomonas jincaotanensis]MBS9402838.1 TetR/AcrR family transcriptional regulator [Halomonas jincaotanensis]
MTRGRPIAFSPDEAASAAMQVFWARGYDNASTRDLLEAMRLSRSSLYQAFGNKEQLFLESLRRYREALVGRLGRRLEAAPSAMAFLEDLFRETAGEAGSERAALGCLIFNSTSELGQRGDLPAQHARQSIAAITALFHRALEQAQAAGDIAPDQDTRALASYLTMGMAGLRTLLKSGADAEQARQAVELLLAGLRR